MPYVSALVVVKVGGVGRCLPLLVSDHGLNQEAFSYFTSTSRACRSPTAQREDAGAIKALLNGCEGTDERGDWVAGLRALLSRSTTDAVARELVAGARDFILHMLSLGRLSPDDIPWRPTEASERKAGFRRSVVRSRSELAHLKGPDRPVQHGGITLPYPSRKKPSSRSSKVSPPAFPARHLVPLFTEGYRHTVARPSGPGAGLTGTQLCAEYNVMAMLYHLLLAFGGLRASEPHHLYVWDVECDYEGGLGAIVYLYHPERGAAMALPDPRATRKDYLAGLDLLPRNLLVGQQRAGWKNLLLEETVPDRGQRSRVYWISDEAGELFWLLHAIYVQHVRPRGLGHPYYFASLSTAHLGGPWTLDASGEAFELALSRIGLEADSSRGLCPHAHRHAYEQALIARKVAPEYRRLALHHQSIMSQAAYEMAPASHVADAIAAANRKLWGGCPSDPASPGVPRPGPADELSGAAKALLNHFRGLLG